MKPMVMEINTQTNEISNREMTDEEFAAYNLQHEKIVAEDAE